MAGEVFEISSYSLNIYALPTFVLACIIPLLLLMVIFRERITSLSMSFSVLGFFTCLWFLAFSLMYCSINPHVALWWAKAAYLGVPFIPAAVYHFTVSVLRSYRQNRKFVLAGWAVSLLFSVIAAGTDMMITGVNKYWWGFYPSYGWPGALFIAFFLVMMLAVLRHYLHEYRKDSAALQKLRTGSFFWAFLIAFAGFVDFLPKYGTAVYPFGYLPIFIFIILSARSIWRYHLEDITPAFVAERIVRTISDGLLVLDQQKIIRIVNRAAADIFGTSEDMLRDQPITSIMDDRLVCAHYETLMRSGAVRDIEMDYIDHQGNNKVLIHSLSVIRDQTGNPFATVCVIRDITERKRAEKELKSHRDNLEELVKERTEELTFINEQFENQIEERRAIEEALKASEERYRFLVENQNDLIIRLNASFRITFISPNCRQIFGRNEADFIHKHFIHIFNTAEQDRLEKTLRLFLGKNPNMTYHENQVETREGAIWYGWSSRGIPDKNGKIVEIITVGRDMTRRKTAEERLKNSHKVLINVLDGIDAIVYVADIKSYEILYINKHTRNIHGDIRGKLCWEAFHGRTSGPCDFCTNDKLLTPEGSPGDVHHWEFNNTTNKRWYDIRDRAIEWVDGRLVRLEIATDITELKEAEEMLRSMTFIDDLTGLYNRRGFMTLSRQQLKASSRAGAKMLLIFADLDNMKWINDNLGHPEGDRALISAGKILRETFRESDLISRIGGDEFVILAIETPDMGRDSIAARLQSHISSFNEKKGLPYDISLSIGTSHFDPAHPRPLEDLLSEADSLMYESKQEKKIR
ncbi:MAG: sensor domain-containing diguanylate cyclase [Nitrospiraceae bacterium]|nr:MAG: sensor domain-containing diguanylate cyclase [Nitrospiraceae bacterium]